MFQVRKYLLMLDSRKDHVKFWRPQMLLMVSNPRTCVPLIQFVNDIKKSGLYVVGNVKIGSLDKESVDPIVHDSPIWQNLVDYLKVKAFVELTLAQTVREGMHHLVRISGLGGMKPNTICMGFYDDHIPVDILTEKVTQSSRKRVRFYSAENGIDDDFYTKFPQLRLDNHNRSLRIPEYIQLISDVLKMNKNVCLCRHFHQLNKEEILKNKDSQYIDVWPVNFFHPDTANYFDNTQLFMLQLACILNMVSGWKTKTILRVFLCVNAQSDDTLKKERKLDQLLRQLRIKAHVKIVTWDHVIGLLGNQENEQFSNLMTQDVPPVVPSAFLNGINDLVKSQSGNTAVTFFYLPIPPTDISKHTTYLTNLEIISRQLPPTVFVHGKHPVTSTTL